MFKDSQQMVMRQCAQYQQHEADAAKWQLVLGMRKGTRLGKGRTLYWVEVGDNKVKWHRDPAEALRRIQEVDDDPR